MTLHSRPEKSPRLAADDWISAALLMLVERGVEAVQITELARSLGVTRGSFYWHFENRDALLAALIEEWRARNSGVLHEALADVATLDDGILALFDVWVGHRRFDPPLDGAIRNWGANAPDIATIVQAEDEARVNTISDFFAAHDYEQPEAFIRARVIYFTQLSYYALGVTEPMADRMSYLPAYFRAFTGRDINPGTAERFRQQMSRST